MVYVFVGMAGVLGAILRHLIGLGLADESTLFPTATLTANLIGSFLLAWFITVLFKKWSLPEYLKTAIGTGFVGSFTTFSTFSVETVKLLEDGHAFLGLVYILVSFFGGLLLSRLGFSIRNEDRQV